jgi:hypothetical protein
VSATGNINDKLGVFVKTLIQDDTFPYDTSGLHIVYVSIVSDGSENLEITLTYKNTEKGTGTIYVPAGQTFSAVVYDFDSIDIVSGDSYKIALYERGAI